MKRPKQLKLPNYVRKLQYLHRIDALPREAGLHMVTVYHDSWCGIYQGKRCDCNPSIELKATAPENTN